MDISNLTGMEVAVIGIAGKFPASENIKIFWNNLIDGKELIKFFSKDELLNGGVTFDELNSNNYVMAKGIIDDAEKFDNKYFGYKPKEAQMMDPQIRMMHMCVNDALENAGYSSYKYDGKIGLFIGANPNYNWEYAVRNSSFVNQDEIPFASILANKDYISTLIAYNLNLRGPCITLDCACSTSLVAVDEAVKQLLTGACDMAVAGASAVDSPIITGYEYQQNSIASPDGHCRPFDKDSAGTLNSEGVAAVVLKRLEDAFDDGDKIYAVIKGSAVNNDGSNKVGFTAPSVQGQCDAILSAISMAGIESEDILYVETHGTATPLGDMVEIEALTQAFDSPKKQFCRIGSVKSNMGHLSTAAGVAGFIKAVLCLDNKIIPPTINFKENNPNINFERTPFKVNNELFRFDESTDNIYFMVSSFGIGGTNACVILTDAPIMDISDNAQEGMLVFPVSGTSKENLDANISELGKYIDDHFNENLEDLSFGLTYGKKDLKYRASIVADKETKLRSVINEYENEGSSEDIITDIVVNGEHKIIFMFGGQGTQYPNMAKDLYLSQPVFRLNLEKSFNYIYSRTGIKMQDILYGQKTDDGMLNETFYCQLVVFSIEYAMASFLIGSGIKPYAIIGHSLGEYVAACISGVFSLERAIDIVIKRAELMQNMERGEMISVIFDDEDIDNYILDGICISVRNGKNNYVLSGCSEAIAALKCRLDDNEIRYRVLDTSHAFHSHMVEPILDEFYNFISKIDFKNPQIKMISNSNGDWVNADEIVKPEYWVKHLRETVRFYEGINTLLEIDNTIFIEVGAGNSLSNFVLKNENRKSNVHVINTIRNKNTVCDDTVYICRKLGMLWTMGVDVDFGLTYKNKKHAHIHLPAHVYELENFYDVYKNNFRSGGCSDRKKVSKNMVYVPDWEKLSNFSLQPEMRKCCFVGNNSDISIKIRNILSDRIKEFYVIDSDENNIVEKTECNNFIFFCDYEQEEVDTCIRTLIPIVRYCEDNSQKLDITVITHLGISIGMGETVNKSVAAVSGFVKAVYSECRYVNSKLIDIDAASFNSDLFKIQLVNDILEVNNYCFVAYRGGNRYIEAYKPFEEIPYLNTNCNTNNNNETYVLIGGLGNVGSVMCDVLEKRNCNLVILSRTIEITDNFFDSWLSEHQASGRHYYAVEKLSHYENVSIIKCDIADCHSVIKAAEKIKGKFKNITAVIHLAGNIDKSNFKRITNLNDDDIQKQFSTKVYGTLYIENLVDILKPQYCILTSSLSSILGGVGFTAYAAANAFLNNYVNSSHIDKSVKWMSLAWDGWNFNDGSNYQYSLTIDEGADVFEKILNWGSTSQYVIAKGNLGERLDQYTETFKLKDSINLSHKTENVIIENDEKLKRDICQSLSNYFGFDHIDEKVSLFELGATSLDILQIVKIIEKECFLHLSPTLFYTYPSVNALVDSLNKTDEKKQIVRENKLDRRIKETPDEKIFS
ncbi:type I polyketide synthase [Sellimonas intestinalis]|uniref:type I polyketide synthase n=1 Tax=Sellimonas intestinalis TaxID=1653434 RepID=UPI0015EC8A7C|nr:type I polyketide synthase [Sellimonas intestinalis]MBA2213304.1 SDR family oxidoreductase [Sellimonas intestinalis]